MATFPIRVKTRHFAGMGKVVYDGSKGHLAAIVQGLAQDFARQTVQNAKVPDFTDSSTGTAAASFVNAPIPTAPFDASSSSVGAQLSGFETALTAFLSAGAVIADTLNRGRARVGLPNVSWASGTIATASTIPSQTKSLSTAEGASAIDYATGVAVMQEMVENLKTIQDATNEFLYAVGESHGSQNKVIPDALVVPVSSWVETMITAPALQAISNPSASATGALSISNTVMTTFLTAVANNIATIAAFWNNFVFGGTITSLTDSTGGTPTAIGAFALTANTTPVAAVGAATTSAPKAGFDTQLTAIAGDLATLAARMNTLRKFNDLPAYTDSTGGAVSTSAVAALSATLSAVDGSTGTVALDVVTATARMATIDNALSSLSVGINQVLAFYGIPQIADAGPLGTASTTLAAITATGTGVGENVSGPDCTMLNTAVETWLGNNRNSVSTLNAALSAVTGTGMDLDKPLNVVAVAE